jgi:Fe-S cluster biogenesis protein NfuA
MERTNTADFARRMGRIESLIHSINEVADADTKEKARELTQSLMELHSAGIERMLEITDATGANGDLIVAGFVADPIVSNLLLIHGLHPISLESRVTQALDAVRPRLGQHGGSVELLSVTENGEVRLRLEGNCHGCPSSRVTLKYSIEEAIYAAAPDVNTIEVEGVADSIGMATGAGKVSNFTECPSPGGKLEKEQPV